MVFTFWQTYVELCAKAGESPNFVAAKLGKSSGSVTAWKNGTVPRETTLRRIADYFNVPLDFLIGRDKKEKPSVAIDEELLDNQLIERLIKLTPDEMEKVDAFVQGLLAAR